MQSILDNDNRQRPIGSNDALHQMNLLGVPFSSLLETTRWVVAQLLCQVLHEPGPALCTLLFGSIILYRIRDAHLKRSTKETESPCSCAAHTVE